MGLNTLMFVNVGFGDKGGVSIIIECLKDRQINQHQRIL